jgi:hypothetical protein
VTRRLALLLTAAAAGLLGCTAGGPPAPVPVVSPAPPAPTPLPATFGLLRHLPGAAAYRAEEGRVQREIAACLAEAGFAYRPYVVVPPTPQVARHGVFIGGDVAAASGYGIADELAASRDATGADPNRDLVARLPAPERVRYLEARYGAEAEELGGCERRARGGGATGPAGGHGEQGGHEHAHSHPGGEPDVERLFAAIVADPRVQALRPGWAACMRERGHPVADWEQAREAAGQPVFRVTDEASPGGSTRDLPGFAAARAAEVAVAVADAGCRTPHQRTYRQVQDDHLRRFLAAHGGRLGR